MIPGVTKRSLWLFGLGFVWLACTSQYPQVPPAPPAPYSQAQRFLREGNDEAGIEALQQYLDSQGDTTFRARAFYDLARAHYRLGHHQATLDTLDLLQLEYPELVGAQVPALRAEAQLGLGMRTEAFLSWEEAWTRGLPEERTLLTEKMEAAANDLTESELRELDELLIVGDVRAIIVSRLPPEEEYVAEAEPAPGLGPEEAPVDETGLPALAELEAPPAEPPLELAPLAPDETALAEAEYGTYEAAPAEEQIPEPGYDVALVETPPVAEPVEPPPGPRIGVLLPLTGPDKSYGIRALTGIRLAASASNHTLVVRDTGGDPDIAERLFRDLASNPDVLAILGPLRAAEADPVATSANQLGLPTLLLAAHGGDEGAFVFRVAARRDAIVAATVDHARRNGARRFAVLFPDDVYGRELRDALRRDLERSGGILVGVRPYTPGQVTFRAEVETVQAWKRDRNLDAVFIPDAARTATTLAGELRARIPDLLLLGTEAWNRPRTLAEAGSTLDGAVFADVFDPSSAVTSTQTFVSGFDGAYGRTPTGHEAQAYDAARLVTRALSEGAATRQDIAEALRTAPLFEGAGTWQATGRGFEPTLRVLELRGGEIRGISPVGG